MVNKSTVKSELRDTEGDEFDYDGEKASINAHLTSPTSAEVGHFVVAKEHRRQGYGSILFESLIDVLQENGVHNLTVEIQALDDGGPNDPVMEFLNEYGFQHEEPFQHHNWGLCVRASGYI